MKQTRAIKEVLSYSVKLTSGVPQVVASSILKERAQGSSNFHLPIFDFLLKGDFDSNPCLLATLVIAFLYSSYLLSGIRLCCLLVFFLKLRVRSRVFPFLYYWCKIYILQFHSLFSDDGSILTFCLTVPIPKLSSSFPAYLRYSLDSLECSGVGSLDSINKEILFTMKQEPHQLLILILIQIQI